MMHLRLIAAVEVSPFQDIAQREAGNAFADNQLGQATFLRHWHCACIDLGVLALHPLRFASI
jgi:hypothetical protein